MRRDFVCRARRFQSALYGYLGPMLCMDILLFPVYRQLADRDPVHRYCRFHTRTCCTIPTA
jgi:hypothetical protein